MAVLATAIWEVRTGGADTNGAGYDSGIASAGTDYSQQNSAQLTLTDIITNGTTTITSVTGGFTAAMIGNGIYLSGAGVTTAGIFFVITRTNTNTITVDRSPGTGVGNTGNVGGAAGSLGFVGGQMVAGNIMYVASGTYTVTSATANIAAGCVSLPATTAPGANTRISCYTVSRGDGAPTRPTIAANGSITTFTLVTLAASCYVEHLRGDCNSRTSGRAFFAAGSTFSTCYHCKGLNCTNSAFSGIYHCIRCSSTACSTVTTFTSIAYAYACTAYLNTITGFTIGSGSYVKCASISNTGSTSVHGFSVAGSGGNIVNCTSYGNGGNGFNQSAVATLRRSTFINCYAEANGVYGYGANATDDLDLLINCGAYNNTSGATNNINAICILGFITLTTTAFNNAAGLDFSINTTGTGGALLNNAGIPGAISTNQLPELSTLDYVDVGVVHHNVAITPPPGTPIPTLWNGGFNG